MTRPQEPPTIHYSPTGGTGRHREGSFVLEVSQGFYGVWWAITHPGKTILRTLGVVGGLSAALFVIGGAAHLIAGQPGSARLNGADPTAAGRVMSDVVRPHIQRSAQVVNAATSPEQINATTEATAASFRR